jgi:hypothetical protein
MRQVRRDHGDTGSALIMALLFVSIFGLVTAALLTFGFAGEKTEQLVTGTRDQRYAADGALDGAIKRFQAMLAAGQIPCSTPDPAFFTYTVHTKTANVECTGLPGAGDTPNPPQALEPTGVASSDFLPYNLNGTTATLQQTLAHAEGTGSPGTVAGTGYPHLNQNTATFTFSNAPPVGASYTQVVVLLSHREGTGPGDAPSQDQSISIVTGDAPGVYNVNCGSYNVPDAKNSGGPNWPIPPHYSIDVTLQGSGGTAGAGCLNSQTRVANARITYNAHATCGGRTVTGVSATAGSKNITAAPGSNFTSNDYSPTQSAAVAVGTPNFLGTGNRIANVIDDTHAVLLNNATTTVTNRSMTVGNPCGSMGDTLDGVSVCVCLWSLPATATSASCLWIVNNGSGALFDCTNGTNPGNSLHFSNPNQKAGIYEVGDPRLVGNGSCGEICASNTHTRFSAGEVNNPHVLTMTGWNWPAVGPVIYVSLRVSHREQLANISPRVDISFPGSSCSTITVPTQTGTFAEYQLLLPDGCAPTTASQMAGLTMTYSAVCLPNGGTGPCGHSGVSSPYAYLDSIRLDLDYQLGGEGGPPLASFTATSGATTVSADAQFNDDGTVAVGDYQVN